jgi:YegS/Rv2252/BmrU family lipid kinase
VRPLQRLQLAHHRVVLGVGDLGLIHHVVPVLVMAQRLAETLDLLGGGHGTLYNDRIATYRQPVLIYNPAAGKLRRNPERILQRTTEALARADLRPAPLATRSRGDASLRAAGALRDGADLLIVLGGDGTVNEVVNAVAGTQVPLAVLPGGTANCLAIEIGLGTRIEAAAARLAACRPRDVALGRLCRQDAEARHFLLMCGVGLDARIVLQVDSRRKILAGKAAYWLAGFSQIARSVEQFTACAGGATRRCGFLLASRIRNYGGNLEIASGASLEGDDFELVSFEGSSPLRYAGYMLGVLARQTRRMPGVRVERARRVEIVTPAHLQIDGEYAGRAAATVEIAPARLRLLLPPAHG